MKKTLALILTVVLLMPCLFIPAFADDSITAEEAEDLIDRAYSLYCFVNDVWVIDIEKECKYNLFEKVIDSKEIPDGITKTVAYGEKTIEAIRLFAESVYTDDLVDPSYKIDAIDNSHVSYFIASEDLSLKDDNYWFNYFFGPSYCPLTATWWMSDFDPYLYLRDKWISFESNCNGKAKADVILIRNPIMVSPDIPGVIDRDSPGEPGTVPVTVSVEFERTANGWRISGGEFVNAMCNITQTKYKKVVSYTLYDYLIQEMVVGLELSNNFYSPFDERLLGAKATYISENRIKYVITIDWTSSDGRIIKGDYTAYFKSISKSEFEKDYAGKEDLIADTSPDGRYLVFYGGGLYDLLVNGNPDAEQYHGESAPFTGDESVKEIIILTSAAIIAACACLCVIRKRKESEE